MSARRRIAPLLMLGALLLAGPPGRAQEAGGGFSKDDLPRLVLTQDDSPGGAAMVDSSGEVDLTELGPDDPSVFASLRPAGLEAVYQNCFDPWTEGRFLCSLAMVFPDAEAASRGMGVLEAESHAPLALGDEGLMSVESDVIQLGWRRSNAILGLTLLDQSESPSVSVDDAMPLARQMDERATSALQGSEGGGAEGEGGGLFGGPALFIGAAIVFLLAFGAALWLLLGPRRKGRQAGAPAPAPAATGPAASPGPADTAQVKYCRNCGKEHGMDATFCKDCGHPFG